jgi:hypothetical protein
MAPKQQQSSKPLTRQQSKPKKTTTQPSSSQNKRKRTTVPPSNVNRFISDDAREWFDYCKGFKVVGERKFDVVNLTKYPIFDTMLHERGWEELNNMVPEENNKSMVMEFYSNARFTETKYQSYVKGKVIDFSPDAINNLLGLIAPEECAVRQLEREAKNWGDSR